jgi:hypothetical protein
MLAGFLQLTGEAGSPRLFSALLGAAAAGAATLLAFDVARSNAPVAGLIAGAATATSAGLVTLGSHIAWSNNSTPLWVVLGTWSLWRATSSTQVEHGRGWWIAAGTTWALALHSHPSALGALAGAALWWLAGAERRRGIRTAGPWLGACAFVLLMAPLAAHNLAHPLDSLASATKADQPVARDVSLGRLASSAAGLVLQTGRIAGAGPGPLAGNSSPSSPGRVARPWLVLSAATEGVRSPAAVAYGALLAAALALALARGPRLVGAVAGGGALFLVLVNASWDNPFDLRYVGFVAVLGWVAFGVACAPAVAAGRPNRLAAVLGLGLLVASPALAAASWLHTEEAAGRTNAAFILEADRIADTVRATGAPVLVDERLRELDLGGGGNGERALVYLLRRRGAQAEASDESEMRWFADRPEARAVIVAAPATADALALNWQAGASKSWRVAALGGATLDPLAED